MNKRYLIFLLILMLAPFARAQQVIPDLTQESVPVVNEAIRTIQASTITHCYTWVKTGNIATGTEFNGRFYAPFPGTVKKARAYLKTAPVGSSAIFDLNKNGTSIWSTNPSKRITIDDGAHSGSQTIFDTIEVSQDDYLTLDIDQVGSGTAGAELTIQLEIEETIKENP